MYTNTNTNQGSNIFCHNGKNFLSNALGKEYYLSCLQLIFGLPIFFDWGNGIVVSPLCQQLLLTIRQYLWDRYSEKEEYWLKKWVKLIMLKCNIIIWINLSSNSKLTGGVVIFSLLPAFCLLLLFIHYFTLMDHNFWQNSGKSFSGDRIYHIKSGSCKNQITLDTTSILNSQRERAVSPRGKKVLFIQSAQELSYRNVAVFCILD